MLIFLLSSLHQLEISLANARMPEARNSIQVLNMSTEDSTAWATTSHLLTLRVGISRKLELEVEQGFNPQHTDRMQVSLNPWAWCPLSGNTLYRATLIKVQEIGFFLFLFFVLLCFLLQSPTFYRHCFWDNVYICCKTTCCQHRASLFSPISPPSHSQSDSFMYLYIAGPS